MLPPSRHTQGTVPQPHTHAQHIIASHPEYHNHPLTHFKITHIPSTRAAQFQAKAKEVEQLTAYAKKIAADLEPVEERLKELSSVFRNIRYDALIWRPRWRLCWRSPSRCHYAHAAS